MSPSASTSAPRPDELPLPAVPTARAKAAAKTPRTASRYSKNVIHAAARDAANRSARSRGLSAWDDEADDAYHAEFDRLFAVIGGVEAWIDLPAV